MIYRKAEVPPRINCGTGCFGIDRGFDRSMRCGSAGRCEPAHDGRILEIRPLKHVQVVVEANKGKAAD
jgi:hypothetical protein